MTSFFPKRAWWALAAFSLVNSAAIAATPEPSVPYTVAAGEKLIVLAARILIKPSDWNEVARFNQLPDPDVIRPGQTIRIPLRLLKSQAVTGKVVQVQGDVQVAGGAAVVGSTFNEGDKLQTGANSVAVVELADGSRVTLQPRTLAEVVASRRYAARDAATSATTGWYSGLLRLAQGTLETLASKTAQRATPLQIETPTSLVGVRGTEFRVAYEDPASGEARTEVLEGKVRADNPAQASGADLPQGYGAVLKPAVREVTGVELLKAPDLSGTATDVLRPVSAWTLPEIPGAARYRLQISDTAGFEKIERNVVFESTAALLTGLPTGAWFAKLRGIDINGLEGYDSVKPIRVVLGPPTWTFTDARLEAAADGRHTLVLNPAGLTNTQTLVATVTEDAAPYTQVFSSSVAAGRRRVTLDLGPLQPRKVYRLTLDVTQTDGAPAITQRYRFRALDFAGWTENTLEALPAGTP